MSFRYLISKQRSISSLFSAARSSVLRIRRGIPAAEPRHLFPTCIAAARLFSTAADDTAGGIPLPHASLEREKNDVNPEMLLPGCDFKHWLVFVDEPQEGTSRDDIIDSYIKTLAGVVGSEDEAKSKMYSVSTKYYYAFGCLISKELSEKMKNLPGIRWVLPDSYLYPKTKDYGGEPFIDGKAVPYDPKYHEVWLRNNQNPDNRGRRTPRRNFDRPRDNWQNRDGAQAPRQGSRGFENQYGRGGDGQPARGQNHQGAGSTPGQESRLGHES